MISSSNVLEEEVSCRFMLASELSIEKNNTILKTQ